MSVQIRNVQLEKEARELRAENVTLQQLVASSVQAAVSNEKVPFHTIHSCLFAAFSCSVRARHSGCMFAIK